MAAKVVKITEVQIRTVERVSMLSISRRTNGKTSEECLFVRVYGDTPEEEARSIEETLTSLYFERKKISARYLERRRST